MRKHNHTCIYCNRTYKCEATGCGDFYPECPECQQWLCILSECDYLEWVIKNA